MNTICRQLLPLLTLASLATLSLQAAEGWTKYTSLPGTNNLIRIEGTSTVHDWQVEGRLVGGSMEVGPGFPADSTKAQPGKLEAKLSVYIPVRSLKSMTKDGKPYSNAMDDVMYTHLNEAKIKRIDYVLSELVVKEAAKSPTAPAMLEAKGSLAVAGVTNAVTLPVEMTVDGNKVKFTGNIRVKMTDFKVEPPAPTLALGAIKTGDEVKLLFTWWAKKP